MAKSRIASAPGYTYQPKPQDVAPRIRGRALQERRERLLGRFPLCVMCWAHGVTTPAAQLDHRHALEDGGPDIEANCWGLCHGCHVHKTNAEEARRARGEDTSTALAWLPPRPKEFDL